MPNPTSPQKSNRLLKNFVETMKKHEDWPVFISEGDSWFAFPLRKNVIDWIEGMGKFALLRLEKNGDEILTIMSGKQKAKLRTYFQRYPIDAILFSGGGNDIVGADFPPLLIEKTPNMTWEDCIHKDRALRRIRQVRDVYLDLIQIRDDHRPNCFILVHGYDHPIPGDRGVRIGKVTLSGPWMKPAMIKKKIANPNDQRKIARWFIEQFATAMKELAQEMDRFIFVETPGTLTDNEWGDEIHPSRDGFRKIAEKFRPHLRRHFPGFFTAA